ncbi:25-hydroxycholesterol 7-alpha-hydroxylase [Chlorella vulgaris]
MGTAAVPPVVAGLPLLGSVLALGSGGAAFLHQCRNQVWIHVSSSSSSAFASCPADLRACLPRMPMPFHYAACVCCWIHVCPQYGDAFTLRLLGQRMTFVFAPATLRHYFSAPDSQLSFAPAALRHKLVPSELPRHTARLAGLLLMQLDAWPATGQPDLWELVKRLVFQSSVALLFGPAFLQSNAACQHTQEGQPGASPGAAAVSLQTDPVSPSGCSSTPSSSSGRRAEQLQRDFFVFEAGFELAASPVPHILQPGFLAARRRLLAALRTAHKQGMFEGTACGLPEQYVPNMLLAVLWASQANAVPAAFWSLGFLLLPENRRHLQAVVQEAQQAVTAGTDTPEPAADNAQLLPTHRQHATVKGLPPLLTDEQQRGLVALAANRRSAAAAAVAEALRLRSFSIDVRIAAADSALPCGQAADGSMHAVWVQKGDVVAISPYECHQDPRLFQSSAHTYDPQREGIQLGGGTAAHAAVVGVNGIAGLSFGGGKYRCPGRSFAETELALITSLLLLCFDWQLLPREATAAGKGQARPPPQPQPPAAGGAGQQQQPQQAVPGDPGGLLPPPDLKKLVGIKIPSDPCWVQYTRRELPAWPVSVLGHHL